MSDRAYTLITGASSKIGQCLALRLAGSSRLILHARNSTALDQLRARCTSSDEHLTWCCDLKRLEDIGSSLTALLASNQAKVGAFVHCAGVLQLQPIRMAKLAGVEELLRVNFTSAALLTSLLMAKKTNGAALQAIVFVSSIASRFGVSGFNLYSASKGALDALMRSLAVELAPAVRVNSVLPGGLPPDPAQTPNREEVVAQLKRRAPLGLGEPDDVAAAIEFLLSRNARWITGQEIVVDGGSTVDATLR